jgi:hypothetical protein
MDIRYLFAVIMTVMVVLYFVMSCGPMARGMERARRIMLLDRADEFELVDAYAGTIPCTHKVIPRIIISPLTPIQIELENRLANSRAHVTEYTCWKCNRVDYCEHKYDEYNLDGDCLAAK